MPSYGYARPPSVDIATPFGSFELDLGSPRRFMARAGIRCGTPPLAGPDGATVIEMTFVHSPATGRFALLADGSAMAWREGDAPGSPPPDGWVDIALAVEDAVTSFVESHPQLCVMAEVAEMEMDVLSNQPQATQQLREMASELARKRRSLLGLVA